MSGPITASQMPLGPVYVNVYDILRSEIAALKAQYGLSDLSIVVRDGKYYLEINGRLIEITFLEGDTITAEMMANLQQVLGQLLEQNGFQPITQFDDGTVPAPGIGGTGMGLGLMALAGGAMLSMGGTSNALALTPGPVVQEVTSDAATNTVTAKYDRELNADKLPSPDDFEVFVNGQPANISGILINDDKVELELAQDLGPNDNVTLKYRDQDGDLEASIQGADGSLAESFMSGVVIDGYIADAQL